MLFVLVIIAFERWTSFRTTVHAHTRGLLTQNQTHALMFLSSALYFPMIFVLREHAFLIFASSLMVFSSFIVLIYFIDRKRTKKASEDFGHLLDEVILEMKAGSSFRMALKSVSLRQSPFLRYHLILLQNAITSGRFDVSCSPNELLDSFSELFNCDSQTHNAISRLMALRHRMRVLSDFRRKSGQATLQIRAQALVMLGLYIATVCFMSHQLGLKEILNEVLGSGVLFTLGSIWMICIGRNYKWKI